MSKALDSKCWRYWMACESPQVATQFAWWLQRHYGGRNHSRPTMRFRNIGVLGRVLLFDVTYIACGANTTDVNRVIAKMCIEHDGGWRTSFDDLMWVVLWSHQRGPSEDRTTWPDLSDQDYAKALARHGAVLELMGGIQASVAA